MVLSAGWRSGAKRRIWIRAAVAVVVAFTVASCGSDDEGGTVDSDPEFVTKGELTVCTSAPYEPFEFEKNDEIVGFDVDLANEVAKRLGVEPVIKNTSFGAISSGKALNDGECDVAAAALTITGERARVLDFSSPYFNARQAMVVDEDSGITSLGDLRGQKIGVQDKTTGQLYVTDNAPRDAEIVPYKVASDVDAALDSGEVDAAIYDETVVKDVIARYPQFVAAEYFDTGEQYGMAVKKNSNVDLLRVINDVLANLQPGSEGYNAIYARWIGGSPPSQ